MNISDDRRSGSDEALYAFGHDDLGPAVAEFLQNLWENALYFDRQRDAKILFSARAGVRIRQALEVFVGSKGQALPEEWEDFWVSRLMIAKGIWKRAPELATKMLESEFCNTPADIAAQCIMGQEHLIRDLDSGAFYQPKSKHRIGELLRNSNSGDLIKHLETQSDLFEMELARLLGGRETALIVDTGWQATSQRLLTKAISDVDWWGAYFGLIGSGETDRSVWRQALGLAFQSDYVDPAKPRTAAVAFRHLIEILFEPDAPSIECYESGTNGRVVVPGAAACERARQAWRSDPLFAGVIVYLETGPKDPWEIARRAEAAWARLFERILTPDRETAALFLNSARSADFGRRFQVPVLYGPDELSSADERLSRALWTQGQIALEYEPGMARSVQKSTFPKAAPEPDTSALNTATRPAVAVITRTMDRPMMLRRALESVSQQTFRNYVHVVVCDGGPIEDVLEAIRVANVEHSKIVVVDGVANRGMEAASNLAVGACDSKFIVIHDDDDTWHHDFLAETVKFLESAPGQKYGGVVSRSMLVSESVHPDGIEAHEVRPYNPNLEIIYLAEHAISNSFPPISFLFRRDIYDEVGGFDPTLPVLGDWDFNLKVLSRTDIAVLPDYLANYHVRDRSESIAFGNSITAGRDKHLEYSAILRNRLVRGSGEKGDVPASDLVGIASIFKYMRH
ncbi:glycosyltransferase family 2 protein [Tropicimonas sp. IMCC34043]|uniref:glycosyltransferase family 2 protein n=1 Tax=Tropicimonas sp. IMCC34043 TaxID=2248760 RepID=UPI000E22F301|nr:glycosyltransferase [Tropicimonas sp. IMCC34043]